MSKTRAQLFALLLLVLCVSGRGSAQQCLSYDPAVERLTGTLLKKTFPGPPNYESVRKGDRPETFRILHLDSPVCVTGNTDDVNEPERNVTDVQLVLDEGQYAEIQRMTGRRIHVVVSGKLFHAHTGHHRTSVLLMVSSIKRG
ncbi:MAG TPA: DUF4431 domain-containing protein [Pyrinomonadaceae bacterium]|nr:DUF4431 domain-containing protein [Pyrinomonadaceae bacterium]